MLETSRNPKLSEISQETNECCKYVNNHINMKYQQPVHNELMELQVRNNFAVAVLYICQIK